MSLANLFLRRQAQSRSALLEVVDALKSFSSRSFHDLSKTATPCTPHSLSAITAPSATPSMLPSLARFTHAASTHTLPCVHSIWASQRGSAITSTSSFFSLGGIRHASTVKVKPPHQGGKLKPYSAFKNRFKMTASGKIRYMRPGNVHKRHNKGRRQLQDLGETQVMQNTYAKTMKRLGFVMRRF
jgi:ribosomal protein L35